MVIPVCNVSTWEYKYVPEQEVFGDEPVAGVYFIQAQEARDGPVKIGRALDVGKRFDALQTAHYEELYIKLICQLNDSANLVALEGWFHEIWKERCVRGEWFDPSAKLINWMVSPLTHGGLMEGFKDAPSDVLERSIKYEIEFCMQWEATGIRCLDWGKR